MTRKLFVYPNLNKIGLKDYLTVCCGGQICENPWLKSLDNFVKKLSNQNINVLKLKFKSTLTHSQITDVLNEIMIACAFHPLADFIPENNDKSPDLYDKEIKKYIEVKNLNEGDDEKERHKSNSFSCVSKILSNDDRQKIKKMALENIQRKTYNHLFKAACQLNNKGQIYLVWDYNFLFGKNIGAKNNPPYTNRQTEIVYKIDIRNQIVHTKNEFLENRPFISINTIYFEELRELVVKSE